MAKTAARRSQSIWSLTFVSLLVINFFFSMGQQMLNNVLPLYAYSLDVPATMIGVTLSAFPIAALGIRPFAGPAFDSFPKKRLLQICYAGSVTALFLYTIADSVPFLFAVRLLHGVSVGCISPLAMSFVGDILPRHKMSSGMSVYTMAQAVAQAIGPAVGIWLSGVIGFHLTFLVSAVSMAIAGVMTFGIKEPPLDHERPPYRISLSRIIAKQALPSATILFLLGMVFQATVSFTAIYGGLRGVGQIGLYFTTYAIVMVVCRPLFGHLSDKIGITKVLVPSICFYGVAMLLMHQASTLGGFILTAAVAALGYGVLYSLVQGIPFATVPAKFHGAASNTNYIGLDLGMLVGPTLTGAIVDALIAAGQPEVEAYSNMWLFLLIPIAAGLVFYLASRPTLRRYAEETARINAADEAAFRASHGDALEEGSGDAAPLRTAPAQSPASTGAAGPRQRPAQPSAPNQAPDSPGAYTVDSHPAEKEPPR